MPLSWQVKALLISAFTAVATFWLVILYQNSQQPHINTAYSGFIDRYDIKHLYKLYKYDILSSLEGPFMDRGGIKQLALVRGVGPVIATAADASFFEPIALERGCPSPNTLKQIQSMYANFSLADLYPTNQSITANFLPIRKDTLIVLTISNHIDMTLAALKYLKQSLNIADLLIVDDFSVDGSSHFLRKKGYYVLSSTEAKGLTYMWNQAYFFAVQGGYKYLFYCNNDAIVPQGALKELLQDLGSEAVVVPMTTPLGAGHNPIQVSRILAFEFDQS